MRLQGKHALVTAAGQGIGRAAVLAMAAEGAHVLATDVKPELLAAYKGVANVRTEVLDVLDRAAIEHAVGAMASLSVLFNCAGFVFNGTILQTEDRDWDFSFNLNVRSQFWTIRAALPKMKRKPRSWPLEIPSSRWPGSFKKWRKPARIAGASTWGRVKETCQSAMSRPAASSRLGSTSHASAQSTA